MMKSPSRPKRQPRLKTPARPDTPRKSRKRAGVYAASADALGAKPAHDDLETRTTMAGVVPRVAADIAPVLRDLPAEDTQEAASELSIALQAARDMGRAGSIIGVTAVQRRYVLGLWARAFSRSADLSALAYRSLNGPLATA